MSKIYFPLKLVHAILALAAAMCPVAASAQGNSQANCARPAAAAAAASSSNPQAAPVNSFPQQPVAAAAPPVMFAAPTPTGEISGGRNSISLPSLRISLPKLCLETPEVRFSGFTRHRREPQMQLDSATAAASHMNPLLMGQLTGAGVQQRQPAVAAPAKAPPAEPAPATAAPAAPPEGCCEGCYSSIEQQKVHELKKQILQLQAVVAHINEARQDAATPLMAEGNFSPNSSPLVDRLASASASQATVGVNDYCAPPPAQTPISADVLVLQQQVAQLAQVCQQLSQQRSAPLTPTGTVQLVSHGSDGETLQYQPAQQVSAPGSRSVLQTPSSASGISEQSIDDQTAETSTSRFSSWKRLLPWKRKLARIDEAE